MTPKCQTIAVLLSAVVLSLPLGPQAFAKSDHLHRTHLTCQHLPNHQTGRAMFYGPGFDGRIMANGQVFDMNALTAASRTLPLGTRARVTNMRSGRSGIVTITDRGRLRARNVILDLSTGAARDIGLTEREGVAPVEVKPISCKPSPRVAHASPTDRRPENISRQ